MAVRLAATRAGMGSIALDTSAAFQHISSHRAIVAAERYLPDFAPSLRAWYRGGAEHRWRDGTGRSHYIRAGGGFDQGDAMVPLAFALATRDMLEAIQRRLRDLTPEAVVVAHLDDATVVVPHARATFAFLEDCGRLVAYGGPYFGSTKCAAWAAQTAWAHLARHNSDARGPTRRCVRRRRALAGRSTGARGPAGRFVRGR